MSKHNLWMSEQSKVVHLNTLSILDSLCVGLRLGFEHASV